MTFLPESHFSCPPFVLTNFLHVSCQGHFLLLTPTNLKTYFFQQLSQGSNSVPQLQPPSPWNWPRRDMSMNAVLTFHPTCQLERAVPAAARASLSHHQPFCSCYTVSAWQYHSTVDHVGEAKRSNYREGIIAKSILLTQHLVYAWCIASHSI